MTITQLRTFLTVAETSSFTKAGDILHMTQPAVSRAISSLEADLGVTLLIRDRKNGILLTDVGRRMLIHIRDIMIGIEKLEQEAAAEKGLEIGTIRIGSFPTASAFFLPKIISRIEHRFPQLEIELYEGTINEVKKWLASREIDIGIITEPSDEFEVIPLHSDKMVALLREDHPLCRKPIICIQDLNDEPLIICKGGNEIPIINIFEKTETSMNIKFVVHNTGALLNMIQEGLGVAILSELSLITAPPHIVTRELDPMVRREICLAAPSLSECSLAVQLFIRTAQELFSIKKSLDNQILF